MNVWTQHRQVQADSHQQRSLSPPTRVHTDPSDEKWPYKPHAGVGLTPDPNPNPGDSV